MQIDITIEDPKAYTKPFTVRVNHRLMADTELMEFVCEDGTPYTTSERNEIARVAHAAGALPPQGIDARPTVSIYPIGPIRLTV